MMIEIANKMLYRKEIPCPYCGFDATWYRRDVTVANQKVKDYWQQNFPDLVKTGEQESTPEEAPVKAPVPPVGEESAFENPIY